MTKNNPATVAKKYTISDIENIKTHAKLLEDFMVRSSDTLRFTEMRWTEFTLFRIKKCGGEDDPAFKTVLSTLKPWFVRKETSNCRYSNIKQFERSRFTHHFYNLSKEVGTLILTNGLFRQHSETDNKFYGFEDPTFYKEGNLKSCVISHEPLVIMHLTELEALELKTKGVKFDQQTSTL